MACSVPTLLTLAACTAPPVALDLPPVVTTVVEVGPDGLLAQLTAPSRKTSPLLAGPVALAFEQDRRLVPLPALKAVEPQVYQLPEPVEGCALTLRHGQALYPYLDFSVANTTDRARSLSVKLTLPIRAQADQLFFPANDRPRRSLPAGAEPVAYGYAGGGIATALPLGQVYSAEQDWGLAFFQELGLLIEPWRVTLARDGRATTVTIAWPLTLASGQSQRRRVYLAATEGDWRPALGAVLAQFPQAFVPAHPEAIGLDGPFVCSGGAPTDERIADWREQGCGVVEVHCTFPYYGDYVPAREPWTPLIDDRWHVLKDQLKPAERPGDDDWRGIVQAVEKRYPPDMTFARINDYIDRLHGQGIKALIYYNPTEAWRPWALEKFGDDVRFDSAGKPLPTWYESCCLHPDVNRPWGRYMIDQLRGELRSYPKIDGVFFDQSAVGGHDLTILCHQATQMVRAQGGICWWNGPYNMELAALADGMMDEGGGTGKYRPLTALIQYYALAGKPIVSLGSTSPNAYAEMLAHGIQVPTVSGSFDELRRRWWPLFRWLRGRRWVLSAHALDPVPGFSANLYRVADGNVIVTLAPEEVWAAEPATAYDVPVTVRLPEAEAIRGAYLLAPDWSGFHKLAFERDRDTLRVAVPRLRWAGLIVLARQGVFPAVEGPLHVVRGRAAGLRFTVDNWTGEPVEADLRLRCGAAEATLRQRVEPGRAATTDLALPAVGADGPALAIEATGAPLAATPQVYELAADAPVQLTLSAPERIRDDQTPTLAIGILSHLPAGQELGLTVESPLIEPARATVRPTPSHLTRHELPLKPSRGGEGRLTVTARRGEELVAVAERPVQVVATALSPEGLKHLLAATLELEVFGSDGGSYAHKPVTINGAVIGDLPRGSGDSWLPVAMPLPDEALKAIAEQNEIRIDNQVKDAFKVRNLRLLLTLRGGVEAISESDAGVYTGWTDWAFGEGRQFAAGEPLTGIRTDLRIDPARRESYEWSFGTPRSGRLILESYGANGDAYKHKPVAVNGRVIGDLPSGPERWTEVSMDLTPEALDHLRANNAVQIDNSRPKDAFKVRRLRLEIVNAAGETWTTRVDEGAYTSCAWDYAEGAIGSPIVTHLAFAGP